MRIEDLILQDIQKNMERNILSAFGFPDDLPTSDDHLHGHVVDLDSMKRAKVTVIEPLKLTE